MSLRDSELLTKKIFIEIVVKVSQYAELKVCKSAKQQSYGLMLLPTLIFIFIFSHSAGQTKKITNSLV